MDAENLQELAFGGSVVAVGAGGNIGSHLVPHLGRMSQITQVTLIDRDVYEDKNLSSQDITPQAIRKPKVVVQARRLRQINSGLRIKAIAAAIEDVPLGCLRGDVILACLDSREARRCVNRAAWRLGVPWINAGVEPSGLLAKVEVFVPGSDSPCLQCGWDDNDYAMLEQTYGCLRENAKPVPTDAPSSLGALAASLQAIECQKLLTGRRHLMASGRQVLIDAAYHKHYVTTLTRRADCRFDHEVWSISTGKSWQDGLTIGQALELGKAANEGAPVSLQIEGKTLVGAVACQGCGRSKKTLRLLGREKKGEWRCVECERDMVPVGFELMESLDNTLPQRLLGRSLRSIGFATGDICSVCGPGETMHHYQLGDAR